MFKDALLLFLIFADDDNAELRFVRVFSHIVKYKNAAQRYVFLFV